MDMVNLDRMSRRQNNNRYDYNEFATAKKPKSVNSHQVGITRTNFKNTDLNPRNSEFNVYQNQKSAKEKLQD